MHSSLQGTFRQVLVHQAAELLVLQLLVQFEKRRRDFNLWWSRQCKDWKKSIGSLHTQNHRRRPQKSISSPLDNAQGVIFLLLSALPNNVRKPQPLVIAWVYSTITSSTAISWLRMKTCSTVIPQWFLDILTWAEDLLNGWSTPHLIPWWEG